MIIAKKQILWTTFSSQAVGYRSTFNHFGVMGRQLPNSVE